jgi:hypothetical protein
MTTGGAALRRCATDFELAEARGRAEEVKAVPRELRECGMYGLAAREGKEVRRAGGAFESVKTVLMAAHREHLVSSRLPAHSDTVHTILACTLAARTFRLSSLEVGLLVSALGEARLDGHVGGEGEARGRSTGTMCCHARREKGLRGREEVGCEWADAKERNTRRLGKNRFESIQAERIDSERRVVRSSPAWSEQNWTAANERRETSPISR